MLILPIERKWLNMILSGEKKDEYREIKPYWSVRIIHWLGFPSEETRLFWNCSELRVQLRHYRLFYRTDMDAILQKWRSCANCLSEPEKKSGELSLEKSIIAFILSRLDG